MPGPLSPDVDGTVPARLADGIRSLIAEFTSGTFDDASLSMATEKLAALTEQLAGSATGRSRRDSPSADRYQLGNPVSGSLNPIAAPLRLEAVAVTGSDMLEVRGAVNFGSYYEGPPGLVHGGHVAAVLDEALGLANYVADKGALTGTLTVRYRKPTPLKTDLRVEGRFREQDGRKIHAWAGLYAGDELLAEADGLFIEIPAAMQAAMQARLASVNEADDVG